MPETCNMARTNNRKKTENSKPLGLCDMIAPIIALYGTAGKVSSEYNGLSSVKFVRYLHWYCTILVKPVTSAENQSKFIEQMLEL